jgi:hypothetical protein
MDLKARLQQPLNRFVAGQSVEERRLEVMAAERDVQLFLKGKRPATDAAATKLGEIIVADRVNHEEVGLAYLADADGFELAVRGPLARLKYRLGRVLANAFG